MSHCLESMMYVNWDERSLPWHGMGVPLNAPPTSKEAIVAGGLSWKVIQKPLKVAVDDITMLPVSDLVANIRDTDNKLLGIVGNHYKIVQNEEAFEFTDALLGEGVTYETAGSLHGGKRVWLLARMPETEIVGEKFAPFLVFTNQHDGKGAVRVALVTTRVVCQNTLNMALAGAKRVWSTKHMGDMKMKLENARMTLKLANSYMEKFKQDAEILVAKKVNDTIIDTMGNALFSPKDEEPSPRQLENQKKLTEELRFRYISAPDLAPHRGTAWGVLNAVSDLITHGKPVRETKTRKERVMIGAIDGFEMLNEAHTLLVAA